MRERLRWRLHGSAHGRGSSSRVLADWLFSYTKDLCRLPITNGWFALFSGIAACPLLALLLKRYSGVAVSAHVQFFTALLILIAGRISVVFVLHRPFWPQ
jgi:hypothetical protein